MEIDAATWREAGDQLKRYMGAMVARHTWPHPQYGIIAVGRWAEFYEWDDTLLRLFNILFDVPSASLRKSVLTTSTMPCCQRKDVLGSDCVANTFIGDEDTTFAKLVQDARRAWSEIKDRLTSAPELAYPDFSRPFKIYFDGSREWGFGVAVHQTDKAGIERPTLFLSKCLTPAERNYAATGLECAALVWALMRLHQYTGGGCTIITDHSALIDALQKKPNGRSARLNRWTLFLGSFLPCMKIIHRKRKLHANADTLSRFPVYTFESEELNDLISIERPGFRLCFRSPLPALPLRRTATAHLCGIIAFLRLLALLAVEHVAALSFPLARNGCLDTLLAQWFECIPHKL